MGQEHPTSADDVLREIARVCVRDPQTDWRYTMRDLLDRYGRTERRQGYVTGFHDAHDAGRDEQEMRQRATTPAGPGHTYTVPIGPKQLREALCVAQAALGVVDVDYPSGRSTSDALDGLGSVLEVLIAECDRKRPVGPDGKHGDRHTAECGCDDA